MYRIGFYDYWRYGLSKLSAQDWIEIGFQLLSQEGAGALKLERLCQTAKKTRGSFYHHFSHMDDYVGHLLLAWRTRQTQMPIDQAETQATVQQKLRRLDEVVMNLDHALDQIIRHWAKQDPRAESAVQEVDQMRLNYLEHCFMGLGCDQGLARDMAEMQYISLLGAQQRYQILSEIKARHLAKCFQGAFDAYLKARLKERHSV